jgi:hypothetical protein
MWENNGRVWRWTVEPGMEDAFDDLLGWLLSAHRSAEIEAAAMPPREMQSQHQRRHPLWSRCCTRAAYRAA